MNKEILTCVIRDSKNRIFTCTTLLYRIIIWHKSFYIIELYTKIARILPLNIFSNLFYSSFILEIIHSFFSH